jgi:hypothetical protein
MAKATIVLPPHAYIPVTYTQTLAATQAVAAALVTSHIIPKALAATQSVTATLSTSITRGSAITWDPAKTQSGQVLSNANLVISATTAPSAANRGTQSTTSHSTGKYYVEITDNTGTGSLNNGLFLGVCDSNCNGSLATSNNFCYGNWDTGYGLLNNGIDSTNMGAYASGDVIGVALNCGTGGAPTVDFYKNGTFVFTKVLSGWTAPYFVFAAAYSANSTLARATVNFGATTFAHTPPTGYSAW